MNLRHAAAPFVAPFAIFIAFLALSSHVALPPRLMLGLWLLAGATSLVWFSRGVLDFRCAAPAGSALLGIAVFFLWIAPDGLVPGWRQHWLFQNRLLGAGGVATPAGPYADPLALALRVARAVVLVPLAEELFWRGWLMRWIVNPNFETVPLGKYQPRAFWITAALFALEHGPYWDVGFLAGAVYNYWMTRTRRLGDLFLAHAVTNACLCAYVILSRRYEYWL